MLWQDAVLAVGLVILNAALVPTVFSKAKPPLFTSLTTGTILIIFSVSMLTLHLWFTAVMQAGNALLWLTLAAQRASLDKNK